MRVKCVGVILCFCVSIGQFRSGHAAAPKVSYPTVKKDASASDTYFGTKVPNPFKWLTTAEKKAKGKFMSEQTSATTSYVAQLSSSDRKTITKYIKLYEHESFLHFLTPVKAKANYFFHDEFENKVFIQEGSKEKPDLFISSSCDTCKIPGGRIIVAKPSPNGEVIAYSFSSCFKFSCVSTLKFKSSETDKDLTDSLNNVTTILHSPNSLAWNTDGSGIYYMANVSNPYAEAKGKASKEKKIYLFYHSMGTKQSEDVIVAEIPHCKISELIYSDDGQFLVALYDPSFKLIQHPIDPKELEERAKESAKIYALELCTKGKAPCKPSKDKKPKLNKICTGESVLHFLGNVGSQLYFLRKSLELGDQGSVVYFEIAKPKHKDWKTVDLGSSMFPISTAAMINSEFLFVAYNTFTGPDDVIVYCLKDKKIKNVMLNQAHVKGISTERKDSKMILQVSTILSSSEAYLLDVSKTSPKVERIQLPGSAPDPFRDSLVYTERNYTSHGSDFPILIMHGKSAKKDGTAPLLLILDLKPSTSTCIKKLFLPFMEAFNGIVAIAAIELPAYKATPTPPSTVSIESAIAAIEFLLKEKYTDKAHLAVTAGSAGFSSVLGAVINKRPDLMGAALLVDPNAPTTGIIDLESDSMKWILEHSSKKLDLSPYYKDAETTEELLEISPIRNIKAKKEYPAVMLIDIGTEDAMRYIAHLQSEVGGASKQTKPLLAKFPAQKTTIDKFVEESEVEQYVDIFSFLALSLNYKVAK